jgi:integrase
VGFRNACKRAGINGVTPHTLRHTAGTLMALAGIDLFLIAKVLGHSVQKTTELYAHFQPKYLRGAVDVLGKATTTLVPMPKADGALPMFAVVQ